MAELNEYERELTCRLCEISEAIARLESFQEGVIEDVFAELAEGRDGSGI